MADGSESALNSTDRVLEAADALTSTADTAQAWIKQQLDDRAIQAAQAHELFTSVNQIRSVANLLYTTAAAAVVRNLGEAQTDLIKVIRQAERSVARIGKARVLIDLIADLIALAAAINSGKAGSIVATLEEVRTDVREISQRG